MCVDVVNCAVSVRNHRARSKIWTRMRKGEYLWSKGVCVCVCVCVCVVGGGGGCWGDNDKHHLGSLITEVHQSTVRPVCLRKSSTDGLGSFTHTHTHTHTRARSVFNITLPL